MSKTILSSTLHDPKGSLDAAILSFGPVIRSQHCDAVIAVTPETPERTIEKIRIVGIDCFVNGKSRQSTYTSSLSSAVKACKGEKIFFCDFDRVLHWVKNYPDEYANFANSNSSENNDFVLVGRTSRAFQTHPLTQKATECAMNYYCSMLLERMLMDFGTATFCMNKNIANTILEKSVADYGIWVEWPVIGITHADKFNYCEAEGLEWETPDRYSKDIKKLGYNVWLKEFQSSQEWSLRNALMLEGMDAAFQQIKPAKNI